MNQYHKQVCIKVATDVQYDSVRPLLAEFLKKKISFDIYIPRHQANTRNVNAMFNKTHKLVEKGGFTNVIRELSPRNQYHLALITPNYEDGIHAKYYVKYSYGPAHTVKPSSTHIPHRLNRYHGYLLHSRRDTEIFGVFSKTYLLPDLKYIGFKKVVKPETKKQTILFMPSWEGQSNLDWIVSAVKELKKNYNIIVKLHPYGDFGAKTPQSIKNTKAEIKKCVDEYYDGEASLKELLQRTDLVISDISGAVFDALYLGVPVTMYSENIYKFDLPGIKSACTQYFEDGYISLSTTAEGLVEELPNALSKQYSQKQQDLSSEVFRQDFTSKAVDSWMKVINLYLNDEVDQGYIAMHNLASKDFWHYKNEVTRLKNEIKNRDNKISDLSSELSSVLGISRSTRLLAGNIRRRITRRGQR